MEAKENNPTRCSCSIKTQSPLNTSLNECALTLSECHCATSWYVSLPTITKLKEMHRLRTDEEKIRLKKRWCFAKGTKVWTIDFTCILKTEHFKLQLLTVSDHRSRFLFPSALFLNTSTETVIDYLEELFLKFGKPMILKADNGPEFRIECREKLTDLCVHLLNSPQYYAPFNGSHERIHRRLKAYIDDFSAHHNLMKLLESIGVSKGILEEKGERRLDKGA